MNPLAGGDGSEKLDEEMGGVPFCPARRPGKLEVDPYVAGLFVRDATPELPPELYCLTRLMSASSYGLNRWLSVGGDGSETMESRWELAELISDTEEYRF